LCLLWKMLWFTRLLCYSYTVLEGALRNWVAVGQWFS
jgi:hypothetical protein